MDDSLATIIVAFIMSIPGTISLLKQLKKDKVEVERAKYEKDKLEAETESEEADATEKIQTAALKMMEVYKKEVEELKVRIEKAEGRIKELENRLLIEVKEKDNLMEEKRNVIIGAWKLYHQVYNLDKTPAYTPPDTG